MADWHKVNLAQMVVDIKAPSGADDTVMDEALRVYEALDMEARVARYIQTTIARHEALKGFGVEVKNPAFEDEE